MLVVVAVHTVAEVVVMQRWGLVAAVVVILGLVVSLILVIVLILVLALILISVVLYRSRPHTILNMKITEIVKHFNVMALSVLVA